MKIIKIKFILVLVFCFVLSSCGTLMKDKRHHEKSNEIDYHVLALNSVGFVFFVIPGMLAILVDYSTGALFLTKEEVQTESQQVSPYIVNSLIIN